MFVYHSLHDFLFDVVSLLMPKFVLYDENMVLLKCYTEDDLLVEDVLLLLLWLSCRMNNITQK